MLNIKPFRQKTGHCGPACLKMVLGYYGIKKTEKELAKLSGWTPEKGVSAESLAKVAKKFGLKTVIKDFAGISDLKKYILQKKTPVIVDWFSEDDGHYSVAVDIDKENIYLEDPGWGRLIAMRVETFKRVWFDFSGEYIKTPKDLILRLMLVVTPLKERS